jgi:hypothetical protein
MALGDNCRSGCATRDHASWGECARHASLRVGWAASSNGGFSKRGERLHEAELSAYETARKNGIQPAATTQTAVNEAYRASELLGKPYNADTMPSTKALSDQRTVTVAQQAGLL